MKAEDIERIDALCKKADRGLLTLDERGELRAYSVSARNYSSKIITALEINESARRYINNHPYIYIKHTCQKNYQTR